MVKIILQYLCYRLFGKYRKGYGIHSPFVYHFVNQVLQRQDDTGLAEIKKWREFLARNNESLITSNAGAGSKVHKNPNRRVSGIIRRSSVSHKYGRVLYYLAREYKPKTILELGTGLGISTAYLSAGNPDARTISVEADKNKASFAENALKSSGGKSPEIFIGSFDWFLLSKLKSIEHPLLVFIDGDHNFEGTMRYFNKILECKREDTIIVLDDIRWSREMKQAWNEIKSNPQTILTIDLFFMGIIFFREGLLKQNFKINF